MNSTYLAKILDPSRGPQALNADFMAREGQERVAGKQVLLWLGASTLGREYDKKLVSRALGGMGQMPLRSYMLLNPAVPFGVIQSTGPKEKLLFARGNIHFVRWINDERKPLAPIMERFLDAAIEQLAACLGDVGSERKEQVVFLKALDAVLAERAACCPDEGLAWLIDSTKRARGDRLRPGSLSFRNQEMAMQGYLKMLELPGDESFLEGLHQFLFHLTLEQVSLLRSWEFAWGITWGVTRSVQERLDIGECINLFEQAFLDEGLSVKIYYLHNDSMPRPFFGTKDANFEASVQRHPSGGFWGGNAMIIAVGDDVYGWDSEAERLEKIKTTSIHPSILWNLIQIGDEQAVLTLARVGDASCKIDIAQDPGASANALDILAMDRDASVRLAVAGRKVSWNVLPASKYKEAVDRLTNLTKDSDHQVSKKAISELAKKDSFR